MAGGWGGPRANSGRKKIAKHTGATAPRQQITTTAPRPLGIDAMLEVVKAAESMSRSRSQAYRAADGSNNPFRPAEHPPVAMPRSRALRMAMDENLDWASTQWTGGIIGMTAAEGLEFPGYAYLAELAQRPEYRIFAETIATECTRKWIKFKATGGDKEVAETKADKIKVLEDEMDRLEARDRFSTMVAQDGFFGRSHMYLDFGVDLESKADELRFSIGDGRSAMSRGKITKGTMLRRLQPVEPVWCYPTTYNATNPLKANWYNPQVWYVMGTEIHVSRILPFIGRPVPDLLKPAYSFGGLSLSQMAKPYVDIWLKTRQSVGDLIHAFSVMVLSTDLSTLLQPNSAQSAYVRAAMFNALRDNAGLMMLNKQTEDFKNVSAPIGGLHELQAQAQEHMASVARIPLVKFTGISPTGLNASSEGEMRAFYDTISAYQNKFLRPHLTRVINFIQLSKFGEIDPEITYEFVPLWELTEKERADNRKSDSETGGNYIDSGVISPAEERDRIANDPDSPYKGLDPEDLPDLAAEEDEGLMPGGKKPGGENGGGDGEERGGAQDAVIPFVVAADDALWQESDHPRDHGKFSSKGGSSGSGKFKAPQYGLTSPASHGGGSTAPASAPAPKAPLDVSKLKKVGAQMGSNEGGVYEGEGGQKYYVKKGKSKDHVRNEMIAAKLYQLAGTRTLRYRPVEGGTHIATEMATLDKDRANKFSPEERRAAQEDFAVHAWLGNWDAVGLGGDNLGTVNGKPTALDLGGAMEYRAQGSPKGKAFGESVGEMDTLRDPKMNGDAAKVFGGMTPAQMRESARFVTRIPDADIRATVKQLGGDKALADKLIARKQDLAARASMLGDDGNPTDPNSSMVIPDGAELPVKALNGVAFKAWDPPADAAGWAEVDGQMPDLDEPAFEPRKGYQPAAGVIIQEADGRVWLVQPRGGFGGYEGIFPKGRADEGLSLQATAIKEAYEESGLKVKITGFAGDREGTGTHTRYYMAERESGDPSQHDDESEGVVLAPADKAGGFLTRNRDRALLDKSLGGDMALDALLDIDAVDGGWAGDDWQESKHPRVKGGEHGGEFASAGGGGGGGGSAGGASKAAVGLKGQAQAQAPYGGMYKIGGTPQENHVGTVTWVLTNKPKLGGHYRRMLAALLKEGPMKFGMAAATGATIKAKLGESWAMSAQHLVAKATAAKKIGDEASATKNMLLAEKAVQKAVSLGYAGAKPTSPAPQPAAPKPIAAKPIAASPALASPPAAPGVLGQKPTSNATPDELTKAAKTTPFYGSAQSAEGQKAIKLFDDKYANKPVTDLEQKVQDYKATKVAVAQADAAWAQATAGEKAKQQAEIQKQALEKAALQKAKEEAEAKANAEKNAEVMKALGINEQEAEGFDALAKMLGGKTSDVVSKFQGYEQEAKNYGYPISGFQAALIRNYTNGGYASINAKLRSGAWSTAQHVYVKLMNKALQAMPTYTGTVRRGTTLSAAAQQKYAQAGHVIMEEAFTSTSASSPFGGNTTFTIKAIGKRGAHVKKLSNHKSEDEVVFSAHTLFKVTKVEGKPGGQMHVHMEEMEHF